MHLVSVVCTCNIYSSAIECNPQPAVGQLVWRCVHVGRCSGPFATIHHLHDSVQHQCQVLSDCVPVCLGSSAGSILRFSPHRAAASARGKHVLHLWSREGVLPLLSTEHVCHPCTHLVFFIAIEIAQLLAKGCAVTLQHSTVGC